ncbi:family 43 glycosylhydrolase [Dysgonomonas gadei]|uniref:family 43 glycosylhydrolase n=1 Tax=Dysgonomonas gadei TaxID=156974 RepID=UPI003AEFFA02
MKKALYILLFILSFHTLYGQEVKYNTPGAGNPIIPGYFADPTVRKFGDTYYIYATTDGTGLGVGPAQVWKSKDFVNWTIEPMNWPTANQIWAPDVMQGTDGRYYNYYSQACKIFCGVSDNPTGPWTNILGPDEAVLIPDRYVKMSITLDAQSFIDDDGSTYLYWGTWGIYKDHGCGVGKLSADMKNLVDTTLIPNTQATDFFEAPYVFKRNDIYYLTYSSGSCHDHTYRVQYATSKVGPMGPFEFADNNPILSTSADSTIHGPGHHSILQEGDDYYIVYHRHNIPQSTRGFFRQIAADKLEFDKDGRIQKVDAGHKGIGFLQKDSNPYKNIAFGARVKASSYYDENFKPEYAVDDNNATLWRAESCYKDEWIELDLGKAQNIKRIWTQFEHATSFYQYFYETSADGKIWTVFSDKRNNILAGSPMTDHGDVKARYIRLTVTGNEKNGLFPAVWNIKVFSEGEDPFPNNSQPFDKQAKVATPKRQGLLFEINANSYPAGSLVARIFNEKNKKEGFDAFSMAVPIKNYKSKTAFAFNGYQQFRSDFGLPETMTGNAPYSISAWIASENPKENECILDINESYGELEKIIFGYGSSPRSGITMHHGWYEDMGIKDIRTDGDWKHIVVTFDGYKEKIYINGIFVKEKDIFLRVGKSEKITLGTKFDGEHRFTGYLNSLRFYDTPLTQNEISELYNQGK